MVLVLLICSTALALGLPPKYIETLDLFLAKLETYQNNSSYVQILDEFSTQLDALKPRYSSS
ncbi:MAG: hypothetical protein LBC61_06670 [Candidatus Peribacteria bacterium]|nr:hypothetical protein [Candidatus Peribacteria bacterium]